jgi:ATP-dependent Clp protease protease subunit
MRNIPASRFAEIEKAMERDTFLEADEAKAFGLVDEVFDKRPVVADDSAQLKRF